MICLISFTKFSDVLPAFTCVSTIGNLWSFCLGGNILSCVGSKTLATWAKSEGMNSPFCCLLKLIIFSTILTILFGFLFPAISFSIIAFLKLILFTNCSFLAWLALIKSFTENYWFWYLKHSQNTL